MPKCLPYEALIIAALALGSCQRGATNEERLEIAEVNLRRAAEASSEMVDRVERAESQIADLEAKVTEAESTASTLDSEADSLRSRVDELEARPSASY